MPPTTERVPRLERLGRSQCWMPCPRGSRSPDGSGWTTCSCQISADLTLWHSEVDLEQNGASYGVLNKGPLGRHGASPCREVRRTRDLPARYGGQCQ